MQETPAETAGPAPVEAARAVGAVPAVGMVLPAVEAAGALVETEPMPGIS